ncbi:helix-turn-helix domain-containing protein [Halopseudomonas pachastrellae]|nr:helix-turn-helix domain-containing protein [Halopseudomonas pachastrellae]
MTDLKRFSANSVPAALRQPAWNDMLTQVGLASRVAARPALRDNKDHVALCASAHSSLFVHMNAAPQSFTPLPANPGSSRHSVLVVALLSGSAHLLASDQPLALGPGDIMLLDPAQHWQLVMQTDFRAMLVRLESSSFLLRLVRNGQLVANRISATRGMGALCLRLFESIAEQLQHLDSAELPALEATLSELLVASLSQPQSSSSDDTQTYSWRTCAGSAAASMPAGRSGAEHRADCRAGRAIRPLRAKAVQEQRHHFREYLKGRRIQHCCLDLANPALAQFSIAQLCYRWGFNDAANFSRTFSQYVGMPPKAYRAAPPSDLQAQLQRGRPQVAPAVRSSVSPAQEQREDDLQKHRRSFVEVLDEHARYAQSLRLRPSAIRYPPTRTRDPGASQYYLPASDKTVHWGYFSATSSQR